MWQRKDSIKATVRAANNGYIIEVDENNLSWSPTTYVAVSFDEAIEILGDIVGVEPE